MVVGTPFAGSSLECTSLTEELSVPTCTSGKQPHVIIKCEEKGKSIKYALMPEEKWVAIQRRVNRPNYLREHLTIFCSQGKCG